MLAGESSADKQHSERRPITNPALVRKQVLGIIEHNTGGPQPAATRVTSVVSIAALVAAAMLAVALIDRFGVLDVLAVLGCLPPDPLAVVAIF